MADTTSTGTPTSPGAAPGSHHIEIKDADTLQRGIAGIFNWIEDNSKVFVALIVVIVLGAIAYVAVQFVGQRQEAQAQEQYYKVEAPFMKKREAFERSKFKAFMPADAAPAADDVVASGDIAKDYGPLLTDLEKVAKDFAGTAAGGQAALLAGETYLSYQQADKAIELAQLPATKLKKDHTLAHLGRVLWGNAAAAKGDCQEAVTVWQPLLDLNSAVYLQSDVSLRSGLCFEKLGQNDRAIEMYRKSTAVTPDSAAATTAKGLLRALELKSGAPAAQPAATEKNG